MGDAAPTETLAYSPPVKCPCINCSKQWQGNKDGFVRAVKGVFHFGNKDHHICGMISHLGPQLAIADGVALAHKLRGEQRFHWRLPAMAEPAKAISFHEALNTAAVWNFPSYHH